MDNYSSLNCLPSNRKQFLLPVLCYIATGSFNLNSQGLANKINKQEVLKVKTLRKPS